MSAPEDKEKSSSTDPPLEKNKVKDTKMLPMQLDKESLEAIMKGVLQAEKCKESVPGGSGTQPRSTNISTMIKEQGVDYCHTARV